MRCFYYGVVDSTSQSSNPTPPTKSPQSGWTGGQSTDHKPLQSMVMANEEELKDIMMQMQRSVMRQLGTDEERIFTTTTDSGNVCNNNVIFGTHMRFNYSLNITTF